MKKRTFAALTTTLLLVVFIGTPVLAADNIAVKSVELSTHSITLHVNESRTLRAKVRPADADDQSVEWQSGNDAVATVDSNGLITGVSVGKTRITVSSANGKKDVCTVTVVKEIEVREVEMSMSTVTVRVDQTRMLWAYVNPVKADDQYLYWESSNHEIVTVVMDDEDIDTCIITGVSPGTAEVTATSSNGKVGVCKVTVPATVVRQITPDPDSQSDRNPVFTSGEVLLASALRAEVEKVVKETPKGESATVTFRDKSTVSTAALRGAAFTAKYNGGDVRINFNTLKENGGVQGQLKIDPKLVGSQDADIKLGVYTDPQKVATASEKAMLSLARDVAVVSFAQQESFGMAVKVAAKVDLTGFNTDALLLYTYNGGTDTYTLLTNQSYFLDINGYLHFSTDRGGFVIITDADGSPK